MAPKTLFWHFMRKSNERFEISLKLIAESVNCKAKLLTTLDLSSKVLGSMLGKSLIATGKRNSMNGTIRNTEKGTNRNKSAAVRRN